MSEPNHLALWIPDLPANNHDVSYLRPPRAGQNIVEYAVGDWGEMSEVGDMEMAQMPQVEVWEDPPPNIFWIIKRSLPLLCNERGRTFLSS